MLCKKPFFRGALPFGCGQCFCCRLNRRRLWTSRLELENLLHSKSTFLTLTYDDKHLPEGGTLVPKHIQDFLKRLRQQTGSRVRYYFVGEYGDTSQRPHYHAAIFGLGPEDEPSFGQAWGKGFVYVGDITEKSSSYIAGYVTKKMTSPDDPRLGGRHPEFARMSLRPGIGAGAMEALIDALTTPEGADEILRTGDVPTQIQIGKKKKPLGRYLRSRLRKLYGFKETSTPKEKIFEWTLQLSAMLETASQTSSTAKERDAKMMNVFVDQQKILNKVNRNKIFGSKKGKI